ncbi:hypothetical protein CPLU01_11740 [Colletotrichum plurivorum]|uniref:C2H2-type domain-containing protein n=1 Tax=Colletotrichum plurivorum TaxID=2175906 RepID=A0A8H6K1Q6_9PEZI|nr:hypothetical protein CPLU01_11740 [Colletotrichum plurivorum]
MDISCKANTNPAPEGICEDQWGRIKDRMRGASDEDRWFRMWDIVFPEQPRPRSGYPYPPPQEDWPPEEYPEIGKESLSWYPGPFSRMDSYLRNSAQVFSVSTADAPHYNSYGRELVHSPSVSFSPRHGFSDNPSELFDAALPEWSEPNNQGLLNGIHREESLVPPFVDYVHILDKVCPDSAYGSGSYHTQFTKAERVPGKDELQNELSEEADATTSYSDVTRIGPDQHQQYIQSLANAISKKLGGLIDTDNRLALANALPDLVKAFAIRIGHENDALSNRAIMYFAHRYHMQIVRQVKNDFSEPETTNEKPSQHGMSLLEKMDMWSKSPDEQNPSAERELFEGVGDGDEDEDEYTSLNLDRYDEIAFRSKAFEWLASDLRRISFLKGHGPRLDGLSSTFSEQLAKPPGKMFGLIFTAPFVEAAFAQRNMWDKIFGRNVAVIRGFPLLRRPHGFPGLELPLDVLLQWTGASAASIHDGLLPHQSSSEPKLGSLNPTHEADPGASPVKNAPHEPKLPALNYLVPRSMAVQDTYGMQTTQELDPEPVDIPESALLAGPVCSTPRSSSSDLEDSATSFDSDMDSTSDYSDTHNLTPLYDDDLIRPVLDIVADRLYSGFRSTNGGNGQAQASRSASSCSWTPETSGSARSNAPASGGQKRKRADDGDQGSRESKDLPSSTKDGTIDLHHKLFTCPFWKSNPNKHTHCFKSNAYLRLTDVKQHLRRKHFFRRDPCYQRCWIQFSDDVELQLHLAQMPLNCEYLARDYEDGIVPEQHLKLSKRAPPGSSDEQAWFLMWDIVFPDKRSRPDTAYIDAELSEDANSMYEYFKRHVERAYCEETTIAGNAGRSAAEQESDRGRVLGQMMERLLAEWLSGRLSSFLNGSRTNIDLGPPSTYTPADSGIVLGTQAAVPEQAWWDLGQAEMEAMLTWGEAGMTGSDDFNIVENSNGQEDRQE